MQFAKCAVLAFVCCTAMPACAEPGDARIETARDAAVRGDVGKLAALASTPSDHALEPYVMYWLLSARIARQSDLAPTQEVREFLAQNDGSWLAEKLRTEWLKRLGREAQWSFFDEQYPRVLQPDQELQCYAIQARAPGSEAARLLLEAQFLKLVDTPESCALPLQNLVSTGRFKTEDVWWRFRRLMEAKRLSGARSAALWAAEGSAPETAAIAQAMDTPTAFLNTSQGRNPTTKASRELVLAALGRWARSDARAAYSRWQSMDQSRFRPDERAYVMGLFGWAAAQSHLPEALSWFNEARGAVMSDEQHAWHVRAALRAGDWSAVRNAIDAMPEALRAGPDWTYWRARALTAQGRAAEAQPLFARYADEAHFYGLLSSEALGRHFVWPQPALPANAQELAYAEQLPGIRRATALLRIDMRIEAVREWNWSLRDADDRTILAIAELARRRGLYDRAINTAERTRQQHDFGLRYLAPYYESFEPRARAQDLDLPWVYGLVRQESRFYSVARSGVGAQGLMQVMPATGRWIANKMGWRDYHAGWLTQIDTNIQLGTAYMRNVLNSLGNHPVLASAAYNAGPGRARRWQGGRTLEGAIYAETIPFTETRDYVKKVMANAVVYATLFDGRPDSLLSRLGTIGPNDGSAAIADGSP